MVCCCASASVEGRGHGAAGGGAQRVLAVDKESGEDWIDSRRLIRTPASSSWRGSSLAREQAPWSRAQGRFALVLVAFVLVLGGLGWAGLAGLSSVRGSLDRIYQGNVTDQQAVTSLSGRLDDAEELILRGWIRTSQGTIPFR
jgi:hypothetical protein